jgi:hypothetical protein
MRIRVQRRAVSLILAGAILAAVAGCTMNPAPVKTATPTPAALGNGLPSGVTPAPVPTTVPNDPSARKDVQMTSCVATPAGWKAGGTVTNDGAKPADYTITVFFTTNKATVIDNARTQLTVAAGKTARWTAAKDFAAAPGTLCVLRGVG